MLVVLSVALSAVLRNGFSTPLGEILSNAVQLGACPTYHRNRQKHSPASFVPRASKNLNCKAEDGSSRNN